MAEPNVDVSDIARLITDGALLLDVREAGEWARGHAPEAVLIPMSQLNERAGELPTDRTILCICHVGSRSAVVTEALNRSGWQAANVRGGMSAWERAGLPVVTDTGEPGRVD
jgi:rhodanese-related sulfurtransferase